MPELPEVETTKNDLKQKIIGEKITGLALLWPGIIKEIPAEVFKRAVIGKQVVDVRRRAKNLIIALSEGLNLLVHLKMTGHFLVADQSMTLNTRGQWTRGGKSLLNDSQNQFVRIVFYFESGKILAMSDLRKFAYIKLLEAKELENFLSQYGPEPLEVDFAEAHLANLIKKKKQPIKKVLMDQTVIAGIGNIYADEILWASRIHPLRSAQSLTDQEIKVLHSNIKSILARAIQSRGTSTSDFRDTAGKRGNFGDLLNVYRRTGLPCPVCGGIVTRINLGGRGTHFCPVCQKEQQ